MTGRCWLHAAAAIAIVVLPEALQAQATVVPSFPQDNLKQIPIPHDFDLPVPEIPEGMEIFTAADAGDLELVQELVRDDPQAVNRIDAFGQTPLHIAAGEGWIDVVTFLLSNKASVDARSANGATPLYGAVQNNHELVVRHLIARGANVNVAMNDGLTPLHWAALRGYTTVAGLLLTSGADVNARSKVQGLTPLHETWSGNNADMARLLIAHGADINAVENWYGYTPLHFAVYCAKVELAQSLVALGADGTIADLHGFTVRQATARAVLSDIKNLFTARSSSN